MKKSLLTIFFITTAFARAHCQVPQPVPASTSTEQQLENITENGEDQETEDDSYLQLLTQLQRNPVNINNVDETFLRELRFLTPMQVHNFLAYRSVLGSLISLYELQSIPGWDLATIQKIRPYITVGDSPGLLENIETRLKNGDHSLLIRVSQTLEKSRGYLQSAGTRRSFYPGSPQKLFARYKYVYKNLLQYGIVAEKDAGEEFFKGGQKQGFDFYSAHLFIRNAGIIKSLALGDFTVNMGQGLTQWMSLAFKKGPDIMSVKRQSSVLRPYNSSGEIFFHRGAGITLGKNNWQATLFGSVRKVDANFNADTTNGQDEFVSSLQTSGLHRTSSEMKNKGSQGQVAFGGNITYRLKRLELGVNAVQFRLKYPLIKDNEPYNLYALSGKRFGNYSVNYSYTYANMHFFGEAAVTNKKYPAFISGLLLSVANNVDMSFFYRNISKGYQSLYTNAFTENTFPTNEKGFFAGISIRPHTNWKIDAYADMYRFPWLKFRVNAPSEGKDYMVQLTYKPNRVIEMYNRYKMELKSINFNPGLLASNPVVAQPRKNWRTHLSYKLNPVLTFRTRIEITWFDKKGNAEEQGFLLYADALYKPLMKPFSANIRLQYFETDGYNSRLYAYENDVLFSFSIPVFYDKGYRIYVNVNYDISQRITVWARCARFIYQDKEKIGSGLDEIGKNHRTELKFQMLYKF
jgi:Helix-hairpin-helix motif